MTITRVRPGGWGVNSKLSSSEATQLDINASSALDKRSGQSDTIGSSVVATGAFTFNNTTVQNGAWISAGISTFNGAIVANSTVSLYGTTIIEPAGGFVCQATSSFSGGVTAYFFGPVSFAVGGTVTASGPFTALNLILGGASTVTFATPRSFTRPLNSIVKDNGWSMSSAPVIVTTTASPAPTMFFPIVDIPHGATITSVAVNIVPPTGHVAVPASLPTLYLASQHVSTGSVSYLDTLTMAAPGSVANYENERTMGMGGLSVTVDLGVYRYFVQMVPENGANALAGFQVVGGYYNFTTSGMGPY